jgi:hypothetical protein
MANRQARRRRSWPCTGSRGDWARAVRYRQQAAEQAQGATPIVRPLTIGRRPEMLATLPDSPERAWTGARPPRRWARR